MRKSNDTLPEQQRFWQRNDQRGLIPVVFMVLFVVLLLVCYPYKTFGFFWLRIMN